MSKTYRVNFAKGVNVVGDKSIIPEGFCTILDNVDLRSGSPRPFKAPEWQFAAPATTGRSWSYRGRWYHSDNWQDHVGEYIGSIERVYTSEEGKYPTKTIGTATVRLGTPRPSVPLGVAKTTDLSPSGLSASVSYSGKGNIPDGERLYRISAKTVDGIMPPTAPVSVAVADTAHAGASVNLSWGAVPKATGYIVFEGTQAEQYRLAEVSSTTLTYVDTGAITASGDNASQFEQLQPFTYTYSYLRNVNGVFDESGLASPSQEMTAASGRFITRDFSNDGYFSHTDPSGNLLAVYGSGSCPTSVSSYPAMSLSGKVVTFNNATQYTKIAYTAHGFNTGDKGFFSGFADPTWNNQTYDIVAIDANNFAILGVNIPTDGTPLPASTQVQPVKSLVTYTVTAQAATTLIAGWTYKITTVGTTDFTLIGAASNTPGLSFTATKAGTGTGTATFASAPGGTAPVSDGDMVYLTGSGGTQPNSQSVSGFYKATYLSPTTFSVPLLSSYAITLSSIQWLPFNNYYWRWRIYRNEQGIWNMVDEVTLDKTTYTDAKPFSALGGTPTSFYSENGQDVDFNVPPLGLQAIESHYGMIFGISGHTVRWTPILQSDAWPETFSLSFGYQPVALASFSQGLIVLCEDAIYRIDGNSATGLSLSKTHAEDGCFAPHSVQKTDRGLMYLSKRGIMLFDGARSECLTDTRIPGTTLTAPSRISVPYPFWWMPTIMTRNYADLAGEDGIKGDQYAFTLDNTRTIEGYNKYIKSFYHLGKYYLFYAGDDYAANTAFVVDLQLPEFPITTMGMKALDAHVDEFENAYVLLDNSAPVTTVTITSPV